VFNKDIVKELCRHCEGTTKRIVECHLPHRADLVLKCEKCQGRGFNLVARQNGNH
jgi:excinuclease UvrABC ATPase subunit